MDISLLFSWLLAISSAAPDDVILLSGGYSHSRDLTTTEVLGAPCLTPELPRPSACHMDLLTEDGQLLSCGGSGGASCLTLDLTSFSWMPHSLLDSSRYYASPLLLPGKALLLGGTTSGQGNTSVLLPTGSSEWLAGPDLPVRLYDGCTVAISDHQFLVIGAYYERRVVAQFDTRDSSWSFWPPLLEDRVGHSCFRLGDSVIIAGGFGESHAALAHTTILSIASREGRRVGDMTSPRAYFGLASLQGRLVAFGGVDGEDRDLGSVEEWVEDEERWRSREETMETPRYYFGYTSAPLASVCK